MTNIFSSRLPGYQPEYRDSQFDRHASLTCKVFRKIDLSTSGSLDRWTIFGRLWHCRLCAGEGLPHRHALLRGLMWSPSWGKKGDDNDANCDIERILGAATTWLSCTRSVLRHLALALSTLSTQNMCLDVVYEFEAPMRRVYLANFTKCSLIVPESRIIADLLVQGIEGSDWDKHVLDLNVLQKRTVKTAATYAVLARSRLQTMSRGLWELVRDGSAPEATHAVLAATVKFSPLFGDFMRTVVRDQFRRFGTHLDARCWDAYIEDSMRSQPSMPTLSDSTRVKLRQNAMRMLAEAGFIESTRSLRLRSQQIEPAVLNYLRQHNEQYVLDCLQVCP